MGKPLNILSKVCINFMMNILVTLNANYIRALKVMLKSMFENNPGEKFSIYLMHAGIPWPQIAALCDFVEREGQCLCTVPVNSSLFENAPVLRHYTKEMYFRLTAYLHLPDDLDRILYLDPDIVVINPIGDFYNTDFEGRCFVAAEHERTTKYVREFNNFRLGTPEAKGYFNTGILLMNLSLLRRESSLGKLNSFIRENRNRLILPDQDILNALYWDKIKPVDGFRYNYDARRFSRQNAKNGELNRILENTVFIHYCGKHKPWQKKYRRKLGSFYRKYEDMLQPRVPAETVKNRILSH